MEAARFPETMIPIYHTLRCHIQEGKKIKDSNMIINGQETETYCYVFEDSLQWLRKTITRTTSSQAHR